MNYSTPKEFTTILDRTFLKFVSVPILFFFIYYCYFSYHQDKGALYQPDIKIEWMWSYVLLWFFPIFSFIRQKKKMVQTALQKKEIRDKLATIYRMSVKHYWFILILITVAIVIFCLSNHPLISLPVWVMIIVISVEKPSIYRIGKLLRFRTKQDYMTFINDQWP